MANLVVVQPNGDGMLQQGQQLVNGQTENEKNNEADSGPMIDIIINNVVCSFSVKCHLNLKKLAMEGTNVEYHRQHGMLNMRIRRPYTTASIWSSGKITVTGAISESDSKTAARKFARKIQRMGYKCKFSNFRVVNVLGTCALPFSINITSFSKGRREASYEPELHPGVTYKLKEPKATLKIFSTGSITVTAPRVQNVEFAIQHIYPLVSEFNAGPRRIHPSKINKNRNKFIHKPPAPTTGGQVYYDDEDFDSELDGSSIGDSENEFDSEDSQD